MFVKKKKNMQGEKLKLKSCFDAFTINTEIKKKSRCLIHHVIPICL